ncbi:N-acetylmuramoyl-L-alanine amidase [Acetonema longum]|uniref:Putative N-acetylmuramoyl-L-alanine amidase n=1 Tax=Acetonema longum DSM 6540 TaxID=1009370 RepID=F7NIE1_9FIRM|nr:N-acetylmuramoyl-L-alanine amidase [Acetonema longum]EGO64171.1 putative N-acetylmuramoyl-L-alanine amidase [Acetonema longum DSM 6540]
MVHIIETNLNFASMLARDSTRRLIIHHTGGSAGDDFSAKELHIIHGGQGWAGIGYHLVIRKDGSVERGRPIWARGAHSVSGNHDSIGIHVCGNFELEETPIAQVESLFGVCADLCRQYGLAPADIIGHRDQDATACPGQELYALLPQIRKQVQQN